MVVVVVLEVVAGVVFGCPQILEHPSMWGCIHPRYWDAPVYRDAPVYGDLGYPSTWGFIPRHWVDKYMGMRPMHPHGCIPRYWGTPYMVMA